MQPAFHKRATLLENENYQKLIYLHVAFLKIGRKDHHHLNNFLATSLRGSWQRHMASNDRSTEVCTLYNNSYNQKAAECSCKPSSKIFNISKSLRMQKIMFSYFWEIYLEIYRYLWAAELKIYLWGYKRVFHFVASLQASSVFLKQLDSSVNIVSHVVSKLAFLSWRFWQWEVNITWKKPKLSMLP